MYKVKQFNPETGILQFWDSYSMNLRSIEARWIVKIYAAGSAPQPKI